MKFKIGDRVIAIKTYPPDGVTKGDIFVIKSETINGWAVKVTAIKTLNSWWNGTTAATRVDVLELDTISHTKLYKALN